MFFGESYAGKYIPAIATRIEQGNNDLDSPVYIYLQGIGIGDGWTDPSIQNNYAMYAYSNGLVDENVAEQVLDQYTKCQTLIDNGLYLLALDVCSDTLTMVVNSSGNVNVYDIRTYTQYDLTGLGNWLNLPDVMDALYASHEWGSTAGYVGEALAGDIMRPISADMPNLMENYRVLVYNGQFDLICNLVGTQSLYWNLEWEGQSTYQAAPRNIWTVDDNVAGFVRVADSFTQLIVLGAGHLAPMNQPANTLDMLTRFINDQPFTN